MVENVLKSLVSGLPLTSPSRLDDAELQGTRFQGFRTVSNPVAIVFDSLGLKLTNGKVVLQGVTGLFQQAHLIAIMGPSGCGKVNPLTEHPSPVLSSLLAILFRPHCPNRFVALRCALLS